MAVAFVLFAASFTPGQWVTATTKWFPRLVTSPRVQHYCSVSLTAILAFGGLSLFAGPREEKPETTPLEARGSVLWKSGVFLALLVAVAGFYCLTWVVLGEDLEDSAHPRQWILVWIASGVLAGVCLTVFHLPRRAGMALLRCVLFYLLFLWSRAWSPALRAI